MIHALLFAKEEEGVVSETLYKIGGNRGKLIKSRKETGAGPDTERYWRDFCVKNIRVLFI